ncbi:MAG: HD domain-containing protein, partial [Planctomycetes bacterium]|nr:HD domain-containing protein [Planctomycetota bacterium]
PIIAGLEVGHIIKHPLTGTIGHYTHIIVLTNHDSPASVAAALDAGANDFIKKPAEPLELRARLDVGKRMIEYESSILSHELGIRMDCYRSMAELAESRDNTGPLHMARVAAYAERLCRGCDLAPELTEAIAMFAPLHDIGKVGVSPEIMLTPGRLGPTDFELVKIHAQLGGDIIGKSPALTIAAQICRTHHERWNGSGYPNGLSDVDIPIAGRIVAVADVYDTLRSRKCYKEPWPHQDAMRTIGEESGEHFDPAVVDALFEMEEEFLKISVLHEGPGGEYTVPE